jgi:cytochrome c peroxidase
MSFTSNASLQGPQHLRDVFYRMGFDDRDIVALSGAHSMGRAHTSRSGFDGPWTRAPTAFSNELFRELTENTWSERKWNGPRQFTDPTGELMMLPSDMALVYDPSFKKYVEIYAKDEEQFFKDFARAWKKLQENGVSAFQCAWYWRMLGY